MSTLSDFQHEFSSIQAQLLYWMWTKKMKWSMGDGWRSTDELACPHCGHLVTYQGLLVANSRSKTMDSKHTQRRAFDLILWKDGQPCWDGEQYRELGEKWESMGGRWGGRFGVKPANYAITVGWDAHHFEL